MLLIPMWQPWASAVALGLKKIETREYPVPKGYSGPVAIHATKKWDRESRELVRMLSDIAYSALKGTSLFNGSLGRWEFPLGQIVAVAKLEVCLPVEKFIRRGNGRGGYSNSVEILSPLEEALGNYEPGRYGWLLESVQPLLRPLPYKAHQGVYALDAGTEARLRKELS